LLNGYAEDTDQINYQSRCCRNVHLYAANTIAIMLLCLTGRMVCVCAGVCITGMDNRAVRHDATAKGTGKRTRHRREMAGWASLQVVAAVSLQVSVVSSQSGVVVPLHRNQNSPDDASQKSHPSRT
jgi:hypothetical protein